MARNKRKQGDGTMRLRKDGRWEGRIVVEYDEKGIPKTKSVLAKTKAECEEKLKALRDKLGKSVERFKPDMPFGQWIDFWYQTYCQPALRETTKDSYKNIIYNHIIPTIGHIPLNKLTQNDLQQFYAKMKRQGRLQNTEKHGTGLSDRFVRSCHAHCRSALQRAVTEGLITKNPSLGCKLPPKKGREMQVLTPAEIERFLARAREEGYYELFLLELSTGMRRGEICGLKWSDISFLDGTLSVKRSVSSKAGGGVTVGDTKTGAGVRTIVMPPSVATMLEKKQTTAVSQWVFPNFENPALPLNPTAAYDKLKRILKRAELPLIRFHDLRHTFATHAIQGGVDAKTLAGLLGHTDASFTLDTYTHMTSDMHKHASSVVNNMMQQFLTRGKTNGEK